ncbi:hypothetical protein N0V82_007249 [Gnomoniopsis sp. IMI 355080]|nr:hypothetical protein N0V82_007249 [Gnomoniopsis sp. IMI 355080]
MLPQITLPISIILFGFLASTGLAYPTWWLAVFQFRCKAPYHVESYSDDWGEWRVSSICAPGTCCSNSANTGPLCTAEACATADQERERLLASHRSKEAMAQKMKEKEQNSPEKQKENLENSKKKEAEWKQKEAAEDAARARVAQGLLQV